MNHWCIMVTMNIIENIADQLLSSLSIEDFCPWVWNNFTAGYMSYQGLAHSSWLMDYVITSRIAFLSKYWLWSGCIVYNWHITPIKILGTWYGNTHHPKLIFQTSQSIYALLHGNTLRTKNWCFNCRLVLREPLHLGSVHIYWEIASFSVRCLQCSGAFTAIASLVS